MRKIAFFVFLAAAALSCAEKAPPQPFKAEEAFREANEKLKAKDYEEARRLFEEIKLKDTENVYAPLAQLRIADSYVSEEPELAVDAYRRFLDSYPRHQYSAYAQYQVAMIYYGMIKGPDRGHGAAVRALDEFEKLDRLYPRHPYKESVRYRVERAREVIAEHEFMVGDFYFKKGAYHGAIDRLEGLMRDFPDYREEAEVLFRLAVSFKGIGDDAKAAEYLGLLKGKYPASELVGKAADKFKELEEKRKEP